MIRWVARATTALNGYAGTWRLGHRASRGRLLVLCYHRIGDPAWDRLDPGLFSATIEQFDRQMRFLRDEFDVISLDQLASVAPGTKDRLALITFDDGYRDNFDAAFPVLQARGVPATFFITTDFIDRPRLPWWDKIALWVRESPADVIRMDRWELGPVDHPARNWLPVVRLLLQRYKTLHESHTEEFLADLHRTLQPSSETEATAANLASSLWMTWDMLRQARAGGVTIGAHTTSHPVLSHLTADAQLQELQHSSDRITSEIGSAPVGMSYPFGGLPAFNANTRAALRAANYQYGFSFYGGSQRVDQLDPADIRRIPVLPDRSFGQFVARCV